MADRTDFYFRQRVTEAELDIAFELLEKADRNLAADIGVYGIVSGAEPSQHQPVADLSIDLIAPARAYDHLGQRIFIGTDQVVDLSVDHAGIPTEVASSGNERWMAVFLKFERLLSDPRTDGNSQQVFFRRDESFQIIVRQAAEGVIGSAGKVPLVEGELLVCDVLRRAGQTQIIGTDIDNSRRQAFVFAQGDAVEVVSGLWNVLQPAVNSVQAALDEVDAELNAHFGATARRHTAANIDYQPHGFIAANNLQAAVNELIDDLNAATDGSAGASRVGADAVAGTPRALPAGNVDGQLSQLLGFLNTHLAAVTGAHNASAIAVTDTQNYLNAANVESALAECINAFDDDHYRGNETNAGYHRTIRQPDMGTGMILLWDARGNGSDYGRFRVYADSSTVYFVINAYYDTSNNQWTRDTINSWSGGFSLSRNAFTIMHEHSFDATFPMWESTWRLPMSASTNSAFETTGTIEEEGRLGFQATNTADSGRQITMGSAVTFRSRFPAAPSSITLAVDDASMGWNGTPYVYHTDRDGFAYYSYQWVNGYGGAFWFGRYTAIA
ncbi:MAG: hypothetical protein JXX14_07850 [Deltaproteobacteria bacterium]|nr:hypothetical protein [Deltaproteobacteria bacterium]